MMTICAKAKQLDLLATTHVTTCTYAQLLKKNAFSHFSRVFRHVSTQKLINYKKKNLCEIRTCLFYNNSHRLRPLHHSRRYSHITTVMIH